MNLSLQILKPVFGYRIYGFRLSALFTLLLICYFD
eukprot:UN09989